MDSVSDASLTYQFGDFELDSGSRALRSRTSGAIVPLTSRAFDLLLLFVHRPNVPIGKQELIEALWPDTVVEDGNLDQAVFALRQALGERRGEHRYIKTIHRRGYQFAETVSVVPAAAKAVPASPAGSPVNAAPAPSRAWFRRPVALMSLVAAVFAAGAFAWWMSARHGTNPLSASSAAASAPVYEKLAVLNFLSPAKDEEGQLLADSVTRLLQQRFAGIRALPVINQYSSLIATKLDDPVETGRRLTARYLLKGSVVNSGDQLHVDATLIDARNGAKLWAQVFDRPVAELTAIREDIVAHATEAMRVDPTVFHEAIKAPVSLEVFELYLRADRLMSDHATVEDTQKARVLFARTTTLDPQFARGYLGIADSLLYTTDLNFSLGGIEKSPAAGPARAALERALELNPALGEAWVTKARLTADPDEAVRLFRRGMEFAPNFVVGTMFFSSFLSGHDRAGEAIAVIDNACRLDPLSPLFLWLKAGAVMQGRSDLVESERLLNQALSVDPSFISPRGDLANNMLLWKGEFAEAIHITEQITVPAGPRVGLANMYLEVDDLDASLATLASSGAPPGFSSMLISQYRRDTRKCGEVARTVLGGGRLGLFAFAAECIRDEAVATGDYASAAKLLDSVYTAHPWTGGTTDHDFGTVFAHTLILAGQVERGRKLAQSLLVSIDGDEIGRPAHWFARERAPLYELLGDHERALTELAASQNLNHWYRWWYTGEIDPIFTTLRHDPRFQALAENARKQRQVQRAFLEDMRRKGEVPTYGNAPGRTRVAAGAG